MQDKAPAFGTGCCTTFRRMSRRSSRESNTPGWMARMVAARPATPARVRHPAIRRTTTFSRSTRSTSCRRAISTVRSSTTRSRITCSLRPSSSAASDAESAEAMTVRRATQRDARTLAAIYNYYVVNTASTFETDPVDTSTIASRIREKLERHDWLVGDVDGRIAGYAYYGSFRNRPAYGHTVESTVYVDPGEIGKGYGRQLYAALIGSAAAKGFVQ